MSRGEQVSVWFNRNFLERAGFLEERRMAMSKRELIEPNPGDKRYARRDDAGRFTEQVDVGKSLAADRRQQAQHEAGAGEGDRGDRKRK